MMANLKRQSEVVPIQTPYENRTRHHTMPSVTNLNVNEILTKLFRLSVWYRAAGYVREKIICYRYEKEINKVGLKWSRREGIEDEGK